MTVVDALAALGQLPTGEVEWWGMEFPNVRFSGNGESNGFGRFAPTTWFSNAVHCASW